MYGKYTVVNVFSFQQGCADELSNLVEFSLNLSLPSYSTKLQIFLEMYKRKLNFSYGEETNIIFFALWKGYSREQKTLIVNIELRANSIICDDITPALPCTVHITRS